DATSQAYDINGIGAITGGAITATVNSQNTTTAEADATVTLAITVEEHFTFASISVRDADNEPVDVTPVTVGQEYTFTMPAKAVTVSVGLTEETKYALTFAKGAEDASGSAPQMSAPSYYEGAQVTLPANTFTYASHKFKGWKIGNTIYAAGATYTMTAEATEAVAQWRTLPDFAAGDWVLVENASELTEESYVIIAASGADFAMKSYASGNNCKAKAAVKNGNLIEYDSEFAVYAILAGNQDNTIAFYDDAIDKYIYAESSTSNNMKAEEALSGNSSWTIDITDGVATLDAQGTNTRNRMRYNPNNNSPIFSCYASISTTGTLVALYKYEAPAFKLIYDKNTDAAVTMPAYQRADNENKVTVTSDQPSRANYVFDGWKDAQQNEYAAGQVLTLDNDLTLYAQWRTAMPYTVSYDANGGQGTMDDVENVIEGTSYTILDNAFTYDETHTFMGWKAYDALNNELTIENGAFTMPSSDVVVKAQWHESVISDFTLVTNVNQLKDGDKVYIVAAGSDYAMGAQDNTNYRSRVEIGKTTGNERVVIVGVVPVEFTLGKSGDNFTFYDGTGYLAATSSASNYLGTQTDLDDNGKWTIAISNTQEEGYVATIVAQGNYTRNHMQYNASPNQERFSCYGSSNTMKGVAIYRKPADQVSVRNGLTPGKYGTICLEKNVVSFTGATMYSIDSKASDLSYITLEEETGALEAGRPYIFLATGSEIKVQYGTTTTADAGSYYGLVGSFTREQLAEGMYIIQNNKFYRTGADNYVGAHKAYINMGGVPEEGETAHVPGRRYVTMQIGDVQTPTALDEVTVNQENAKFILNGQLYILRDGKLYNAQGQLVK
ncbi:MAG: InlB B-repeat-containing protein, partial [Paludibacteraceae bacterium]|nr:InlB B-repeat-containing protein [Paludibacteraceae bacterium]